MRPVAQTYGAGVKIDSLLEVSIIFMTSACINAEESFRNAPLKQIKQTLKKISHTKMECFLDYV